MTAWDWFKANGDDVLSFLTMVGVVAQNQRGLVDQPLDKWLTFSLAICAIAHKVFFAPNKTSIPPTTPAHPAQPQVNS